MFRKRELTDIVKAWLAISLAFAIILHGFSLDLGFLLAFLMAAFTVGLGFLLHELAHKFVAQHYGCFAEFKAFDIMLIFAVVLSFLDFIIAAPGAVMISGDVTRRENGIISAAGPLVNIALASIFIMLGFTYPSLVWNYGAKVNAWLAIFNMLPFWILDGRKVFDWNKGIWGAIIATAVVLLWVL